MKIYINENLRVFWVWPPLVFQWKCHLIDVNIAYISADHNTSVACPSCLPLVHVQSCLSPGPLKKRIVIHLFLSLVLWNMFNSSEEAECGYCLHFPFLHEAKRSLALLVSILFTFTFSSEREISPSDFCCLIASNLVGVFYSRH